MYLLCTVSKGNTTVWHKEMIQEIKIWKCVQSLWQRQSRNANLPILPSHWNQVSKGWGQVSLLNEALSCLLLPRHRKGSLLFWLQSPSACPGWSSFSPKPILLHYRGWTIHRQTLPRLHQAANVPIPISHLIGRKHPESCGSASCSRRNRWCWLQQQPKFTSH